ncbi:enolase C-terminal domain-like protein [Streptomyces antarcticus]|uniref:enolase C-terminal domain-like protein n=1 Tax=Streptomyces antarcticus TaxID=2996458 RepID=UPI0022700834|nr:MULTISPECIES: enolase C-terminal domain-like protein [unclassified Streptomyces]MCY0941132.1 dipeptide epimerase [Streptomyces sp. H34-AA3]MCZ4084209.1 dipeptide epimerase [Streptomyces sp. H34-S5]
MKLTWHTADLRLTQPLRISRSVMARRDAVWAVVEHGGLRGWGEAVSSEHLGLPTARILHHLAAARAATERFPDPETAWAETGRPGEGGAWHGLPPGVLAALEAAVLDLVGKRADRPAHRLLDPDPGAGQGPLAGADSGAVQGPAVATARTIGITGPAEAAALAARLTAAGFTVLKVKAGHPDPAEDLARVEAVHAAAPGASLLLDPNGAWTERRARDLLPRFAALGVTAVEQPVAPGSPDSLARVAADSPVPVIADEDAVSYEDAVALAGRVHGVNVKLAKCGGVRAALRIHAALRGTGTDLMLGCLTASSLGIAPAVHLAGRARWVDLDGHLLLADDPWTGIGGADGTVRASGRPGLGVRRVTGGGGVRNRRADAVEPR